MKTTIQGRNRRLIEEFDPRTLAALEGLDLKARYVMEGFLAGLHQSPFHGFSVEFSDYRNYQPGDDLRHLDWRLYARSDRLCIKRYLQETNVRFYVVVDTSASMAYRGSGAWGSKLDHARLLAAALTWFLLRQNDAAGMITLSGGEEVPKFIRPSQRPSQFGLMLRQLEQLTPAGGACLAKLIQHTIRLVHRRSIILLFSDLLEPADDVALGFKQLRFHGHECIIFQILDRDETEFPFTEARVFQDLETGQERNITPAAVRATYLERFNAFMEAWRELFRGLEMAHCVVQTDDNPGRALARFLSERRKYK
ncbi:MAG: DUF58 domain-containing protein [Verrucomicrobia subdivision 3 bacterium]|nr:DUF58 domain-containing protein [Limisphaerales bacterium]